MKKAVFIVIYSRKDIDSFMKAADLFNGKNLGTVHEVTVEYNDNIKLTLAHAKKNINRIKGALEKSGQIVSFIHLRQIQNGDTIKLNTKILPYYDSKAREISDGHKAFIFKNFIEWVTPFVCVTDNNFYITELKPKYVQSTEPI